MPTWVPKNGGLRGKTVENLNPWYIDSAKGGMDTESYRLNIKQLALRNRMSEKPSLYVVEKKEVIILVVLFVLVTVLSFTLGVRYGESVGKKQAHELADAAKEHLDDSHDSGGSLGKTPHSEEPAEAKHEDASAAPHDEHAAATAHEPAKDSHADAGEHAAEHGDHAVKTPEAKTEPESHSPEAAASHATPVKGTHEAVDKNSDEYLLNALKDAGVESPGGKAPKEAKLPDSVKEVKKGPPAEALSRVKSGAFVIQVGSHPTRGEAEAQVRSLKARKVNAEILNPFKDKQGEWHRVVIASFKSKHEAEREAGSLKSKGSIVNYFVWRLP